MAFDDACKGTTGPDHPEEMENGTPGCTDPAVEGAPACPQTPDDLTCAPYQLDKAQDSCFVDGVVNEALNIAGAPFNVYKMLGVHEQCKIVDSTGQGSPLSGGYAPGFPPDNAFDVFVTEWRSVQKGEGVNLSSYLGYDFGFIRTNDLTRRMYGDADASIRKHITALGIKQSANAKNRVTRARVERSEDGKKWYGVAIVNLPDDDCLNTILFRDSVQNRYWRLRPIEFNGGVSDYWGVQALQMYHNYVATDEENIQDKILLENRDRDYSEDPILMKGYYDLSDIQSDLNAIGIEIPSDIKMATFNFNACVSLLNRPLIIGDIVEIPSEAQYSAEMRLIKKWMEVTDVTWASEGYTPGWKPTLLKVTLQPALVTQETQDLFGDLAEEKTDGGLPDALKFTDEVGRDPIHQDYSDVSQVIQADAKDKVPQHGQETSGTVRQWEQEELEEAAVNHGVNLQKIGQFPTGFYTEDAMPPNNLPFTEGPDYPGTPSHGDYHRLTYEGLAKDVPARLYRYSASKGRWIFLEKDRRAEDDGNKPRLQEFLTASVRKPLSAVCNDEPPKCEEE